MYIQVLFSTIDYKAVCAFYNENKDPNANPLEEINRIEGGFMIKRKMESKDGNVKLVDDNAIVKQARWSRKNLFTPTGYYTFSDAEWILIHQSLMAVYGPEQAILHNGRMPPIR